MEGRGGSGWRVRSQWVVPISEVVNTGAAEGRGRQGRPVRGAKCLVLGAKEEFETPYSGPEPRRCLQPSGGAGGAKRETLEHSLAALWWLESAAREKGAGGLGVIANTTEYTEALLRARSSLKMMSRSEAPWNVAVNHRAEA